MQEIPETGVASLGEANPALAERRDSLKTRMEARRDSLKNIDVAPPGSTTPTMVRRGSGRGSFSNRVGGVNNKFRTSVTNAIEGGRKKTRQNLLENSQEEKNAAVSVGGGGGGGEERGRHTYN